MSSTSIHSEFDEEQHTAEVETAGTVFHETDPSVTTGVMGYFEIRLSAEAIATAAANACSSGAGGENETAASMILHELERHAMLGGRVRWTTAVETEPPPAPPRAVRVACVIDEVARERARASGAPFDEVSAPVLCLCLVAPSVGVVDHLFRRVSDLEGNQMERMPPPPTRSQASVHAMTQWANDCGF